MLLFVKKPWCYQLASGEKTLELRAGTRYRNLRAGSSISVNGRERYAVERVERFETLERFLTSLIGRHQAAGFNSSESLREGVDHCYGSCDGPFFVFTLSRIPEPALEATCPRTQSLPLFD